MAETRVNTALMTEQDPLSKLLEQLGKPVNFAWNKMPVKDRNNLSPWEYAITKNLLAQAAAKHLPQPNPELDISLENNLQEYISRMSDEEKNDPAWLKDQKEKIAVFFAETLRKEPKLAQMITTIK